MMEKMERVEREEEMTDVVEAIDKVGNTEEIVASREVETSTGQKLEKTQTYIERLETFLGQMLVSIFPKNIFL